MSEVIKQEASLHESENTISPVPTNRSQRILDPESDYDDPMEGRTAEKIASEVQTQINFRALPTRAYINATVAETVLKALSELDKCRPDNPVEFFAYYLLKHAK